MVTITYSPANLDTLRQMLAENGRYIVEIHNRRIVKCEKATSILPARDPVVAHTKETKSPPADVEEESAGTVASRKH